MYVINYQTGYFMTWRLGGEPYFTSKNMAKLYSTPAEAQETLSQMSALGFDLTGINIIPADGEAGSRALALALEREEKWQ